LRAIYSKFYFEYTKIDSGIEHQSFCPGYSRFLLNNSRQTSRLYVEIYHDQFVPRLDILSLIFDRNEEDTNKAAYSIQSVTGLQFVFQEQVKLVKAEWAFYL
jgi:hypothetical protein